MSAGIAERAPDRDAPGEVLVRCIRLRVARRMAWLQTIGALYDGIERVQALLDDRDAPDAERVWQSSDPAARELGAEIDRAGHAWASSDARLRALARAFALDEPQRQTLEVALALELDGDLAELFAFLARRGGHASPFDVIARLFGHGRTLQLAGDSPLLAWSLVIPTPAGEAIAIQLDPFVAAWLGGSDALDPQLAGRAAFCTPRAPFDPELGARAMAALMRVRERAATSGARMWIRGMHGSGRRTLAAWLAAQLRMRLLVVELPAVTGEARAVQHAAQRYALLTSTALAYRGTLPSAPAVAASGHGLLELVIAPPRAHAAAVDAIAVETAPLTVEQRRSAWSVLLPATAAWPAVVVEALARDFSAGPGDIAAVARAEPRDGEAALALLRTRRHGRFDRLAQRLETPFDWDDLVVGETVREALDELAFEARARRTFWERPEARRLFPQGRGLLAMFTGQPGTGKTMAAQVVARELGVDLVRVDLSAVVSKYIGETSQNIDRILRRAARADVVLFFDEADALFGKRTEMRDAHDRYANTDTNFLLQAIESYDGIALLATNQKGNVDPAFMRRVRFAIEFQRPDAESRARIWSRIVGELAGAGAALGLEPVLRRLATELDASGAQIKFAVLSGVMLAVRANEPLAARHLLRGLERELRKEGRILGERERRGLLDGVA